MTKSRISFRGFEELIEFFKKKETPEDTACLMPEERFIDTDSLRRLVIAWPKARRSRINPWATTSEEGDVACWRWLWEQVDYDQEELKRIAGVGSNITSLMDILIGNRLLYPDGTVSLWAQKVIRQVFKTRLGI